MTAIGSDKHVDGITLEHLSNSQHLDDFAEAAGMYVPLKARGLHDDLLANHRKLTYAPTYAVQAWVLQELTAFALAEGRRTEELRKKAAYILSLPAVQGTLLFRLTESHLWYSSRATAILVFSSNLKVPANFKPSTQLPNF